MRILGWIITLSLWSFLAAFLHYSLPQRDIVRIQGTEILRVDISGLSRWFFAQGDSGSDQTVLNRDLRLINATRPNGDVITYRNEDTGLFGWPPYFKINSQDTQAEAQGSVSTSENPKWFLVTHYGWRFNAPTIYPNVIRIRAIEGPDTQKPLPWVNIAILAGFGFVFISIWSRWRRFRRERLDPAFEEIQDNLEGAGDAFAARRGRLKRWLRGS